MNPHNCSVMFFQYLFSLETRELGTLLGKLFVLLNLSSIFSFVSMKNFPPKALDQRKNQKRNRGAPIWLEIEYEGKIPFFPSLTTRSPPLSTCVFDVLLVSVKGSQATNHATSPSLDQRGRAKTKTISEQRQPHRRQNQQILFAGECRRIPQSRPSFGSRK